MSPRLNRVWLGVPFLLLALQAWALGLGDIRLSSALNQPLRAEIELLAATPEELNNLTVQLASQETFDRYDLDRPVFLSSLQFDIVKSGSADGNVIRVTSLQPITEPFVTFLVEASWSRGRLLREYTLLLDPPTFAPPPSTQQTEAVTAPTRAAPADSGEIQRPAPEPQPAPPPRQTVRPPVQAPATTTPQPADQAPSAPLEGEPGAVPIPREEPAAAPAPQEEPGAVPVLEPQERFTPSFDTTSGGDFQVVRGDTLWGITQQVRPDARLSINQTMLAIFEANPDAFEGNINRLKAGVTLRIPSADDIFRIGRRDAFAEVLRQNEEWRGAPPTVAEPAPEPLPVPTEPEPAPAEATTPSLTLVPPDEEDLSLSDESVDSGIADTIDEPAEDVAVSPEERIQQIEEILNDQDALIAIPDNELAALRQELAELRGEDLFVEEPVDETPVDDLLADDEAGVEVDDSLLEDDTAAPEVRTAPTVVTRPAQEESLVDTILGYLNNFWVWIGAALVVTVGILFWFMRRAANREDEDATGVWDALDSDEMDMVPEGVSATESLSALARGDDDSIVVVETETVAGDDLGMLSDTMEAPAAEEPSEPTGTMEMPQSAPAPVAEPEPEETLDFPQAAPEADPLASTDTNKALEDTFSSETAINLDQSDPIAEADFHMAYGLYDQAADLINGALSNDPDRQDLLAKLCEIYFVWGNRDAFIDAAGRMKSQVGDGSDPEWDKIVIMGQQIAGDHELFTGVSAEGVTKAVDLSFEGGDEAGDLDMDFAGDADSGSSDVIDLGSEDDELVDLGAGDDDVIDLGGGDDTRDEPLSLGGKKEEVSLDETGQVLIPPDSGSGIDFSLDDDVGLEASATREMLQQEEADADEGTGATPTIEQQFNMDSTGEMPAATEADKPEIPAADATAEIDLDDLGLDLDSLEDTALGDDLEDTASGEALEVDDDALEETGRNEALDITDTSEALDETGTNETPVADDLESTSTREVLDIEADLPSFDDGDATGIGPGLSDDEATKLASLDDEDDHDEDTDVGIDTSLLDATGQTQVLTEDMAVETAADIDVSLPDDEATMLAKGLGGDQTANEPVSSDAATLLAPMDEDEEDGDFDFAKTEALPKDVFSPDMSTDDTGRMPGLTGSTDMDLDLDDLTAALRVSEVGDTVNQLRDDATVEQPRLKPDSGDDTAATGVTQSLSPDDMSGELSEARTMTEVGTKLDLARAYVDMGDPAGAKSILEEVLDEGDEGQRQQAQQLIDSLPT